MPPPLFNPRGGIFCSAVNCDNARRKNPELSYFKFPTDPERCKMWIINCRRADWDNADPSKLRTTGICLCENHFEASHFMNPAEKGIAKPRKRLIHTAVPTIFDFPSPPAQVNLKRRLFVQHNFETSRKKMKVFKYDDGSTNNADQATEHADEATETINVDTVLITAAVQDPKTKTSTPVKTKLGHKSIKKNQISRSRITRAIKKPRNEIQKTSDQNKQTLEHDISESLSNSTLTFIKGQMNKSKKSIRWTGEDKMIALSIYHSSPKFYRLLSKLFTLPTEHTLKLLVQNIEFDAGISDSILNMLKLKVDKMSEQERLCALSFDEMPLKKGQVYVMEDYGPCIPKTGKEANHGLVFMICGVASSWKQVLGFALTNNSADLKSCKTLLFQWLSSLKVIGLNVVAIVCDQGPINQKLVEKTLDISEHKTSFTYNDEKYYVLYDIPQLLTCTRNDLVNHGHFLVHGKEVQWLYISKLFELEKRKPFKLRTAPKLTKKHIHPRPLSKMKVKLAAQVFSNSVFTSLVAYMGKKIPNTQNGKHILIPLDAEHTARFIKDIDTLFDCCNSKNLHDPKIFRRVIKPNSKHKDHMLRCIQMFKSLKIPGVKSKDQTAPCIRGWIITLTSILSLWNDLQSKYNLKFFMTSRLNQDCLENVFSKLRQRGGNKENPTPSDFCQSLKQVMVSELMDPINYANCEADLDTALLNIRKLQK